MNPLFLNRLRVSDNRVFSIFFFFFLIDSSRRCITKQNYSWGDATQSYSTEIGSPQKNKVQIQPKSHLMNQWVYLGLFMGIWVKSYLQEQKTLNESCVSKAHPSTGDSPQKLTARSTLCSLQVGACSFQKTWGLCLFQSVPLVSASFRQSSL